MKQSCRTSRTVIEQAIHYKRLKNISVYPCCRTIEHSNEMEKDLYQMEIENGSMSSIARQMLQAQGSME